ncbi:uncharacterized protein LOC110011754 [Sesamum indicum]|uniref:Uncharacterized protein LOC110011754 n=1 Tax=Sesamum indicum TaxID=4182 RepID=A0A8M8UXF9_SESIN|nr:uncharacterized protein LOC110011754 [Sesamum indicum]
MECLRLTMMILLPLLVFQEIQARTVPDNAYNQLEKNTMYERPSNPIFKSQSRPSEPTPLTQHIRRATLLFFPAQSASTSRSIMFSVINFLLRTKENLHRLFVIFVSYLTRPKASYMLPETHANPNLAYAGKDPRAPPPPPKPSSGPVPVAILKNNLNTLNKTYVILIDYDV